MSYIVEIRERLNQIFQKAYTYYFKVLPICSVLMFDFFRGREKRKSVATRASSFFGPTKPNLTPLIRDEIKSINRLNNRSITSYASTILYVFTIYTHIIYVYIRY